MYNLLDGETPAQLSRTVREYIKHGWEVYGDPIVITKMEHNHQTAVIYCQAVIKLKIEGERL